MKVLIMSDQINTPISPGELVDKITILEIKKEKSFCPHCGEKLPSD